MHELNLTTLHSGVWQPVVWQPSVSQPRPWQPRCSSHAHRPQNAESRARIPLHVAPPGSTPCGLKCQDIDMDCIHRIDRGLL